MNEKNETTPETPSEVVSTGSNRVDVSADLLNEAVTQLRKLSDIRQRESERQERAIAQMHTALKRQGLLSRYVILTCTVALLASVGVAYLVRKGARNEAITADKLGLVDQRLSAAAQTIAEETQRQVSTLDKMRGEVITSREESTRLSRSLEQELQANRQTQASVIEKVEEQLGAVRAERDEVRGEVRNVLESKTKEFTDREIELRAEREAIKDAKRRSKDEQKALIQQTIERLNAMTAVLSAEEDASSKASDNPSLDSEIEEVIDGVNEAEASIAESTGWVDKVKEAAQDSIEAAGDAAEKTADTIVELVTGKSGDGVSAEPVEAAVEMVPDTGAVDAAVEAPAEVAP
jgi:chromosome segregation ATPase